MSTVTVPQILPSPEEDCKQLRAAFAGWGTNEKLIISILGHRKAHHIKLIKLTYSELYKESLLKDLDEELSSHFKRAIYLWTLDPAERDAFLADEAIKRWSSKDTVLLEIACSRSPKELTLVRDAYHARFKRSIEEDIAPRTSSGLRKLLVGLITSYRYGGDEVNIDLAKKEAQILQDKIKGNSVNHEEVIRILTTRSKAHLRATLNYYKDTFGNDINKDLKTDPNDEYLSALRVAIKCLTTPEKHFEKVIRVAIKGLGTDEGALTRAVVTRADIDMKQIKEEYEKRNQVALVKAIVGDTSFDYEDFLLALVGHGDA